MGSLDAMMIRRHASCLPSTTGFVPGVEADARGRHRAAPFLREGEARQFWTSYAAMFVTVLAFLA